MDKNQRSSEGQRPAGKAPAAISCVCSPCMLHGIGILHPGPLVGPPCFSPLFCACPLTPSVSLPRPCACRSSFFPVRWKALGERRVVDGRPWRRPRPRRQQPGPLGQRRRRKPGVLRPRRPIRLGGVSSPGVGAADPPRHLGLLQRREFWFEVWKRGGRTLLRIGARSGRNP